MILNSVKNITRRSWYTIPMPDTFISHINKLACNEPNQFTFIDRRYCPIGDVDITGMDRYTDDSNKKQAPKYPSHEFQTTE